VSLLFFLLIGRGLDQLMRRQATGAAENLLGLLSPATTVVRADGTTTRVATRTLSPGMALLIAAGERIPVDARLTHGRGEINESLMTGETRPRPVKVGDMLYAGTINLSGPLEATAVACEENTLLAEITRLMQTAEQARGRYVRLTDRAAQLYAPAVHILGLATFLGRLWAGYGWVPRWGQSAHYLALHRSAAHGCPGGHHQAQAPWIRNRVAVRGSHGCRGDRGEGVRDHGLARARLAR